MLHRKHIAHLVISVILPVWSHSSRIGGRSAVAEGHWCLQRPGGVVMGNRPVAAYKLPAVCLYQPVQCIIGIVIAGSSNTIGIKHVLLCQVLLNGYVAYRVIVIP